MFGFIVDVPIVRRRSGLPHQCYKVFACGSRRLAKGTIGWLTYGALHFSGWAEAMQLMVEGDKWDSFVDFYWSIDSMQHIVPQTVIVGFLPEDG